MNHPPLLTMKLEKTPARGTAVCRICGEKITDPERVRLYFGVGFGVVTHEKCIKQMYDRLLLRQL
jgi:hypothetical protein